MISAALVHVPHPSGVIRFGIWGEGGMVQYTPPRNTIDPRYDACTDHHVACDCREAEFAEYRAEAQADHQLIQAAFDRLLAGHPTRTYDDSPPCQCSGCQIARACSIYPHRGAA